MNRIEINDELWHRINVGGEIPELTGNFQILDGCKRLLNADLNFPFILTHRGSNHQLQFFNCQFINIVIIEHTGEWQGVERFVDFIECLMPGLEINGNNVSLNVNLLNCQLSGHVGVSGDIKSLRLVNGKASQQHKIELSIHNKSNAIDSTIEIDNFPLSRLEIFDSMKVALLVQQSDVDVIEFKHAPSASINLGTSRIGSVLLSGFRGDIRCIQCRIDEMACIGFSYAQQDQTLVSYRFEAVQLGRLEMYNLLRLAQLYFGDGCQIGILAFGNMHVTHVSINNSSINWLLVPTKLMEFELFELSGGPGRLLQINYLSFLDGYFEQTKGVSVKPKIVLDNLGLYSIDFASFHNNSLIYVANVEFRERKLLDLTKDYGAVSTDFRQLCLDNGIMVQTPSFDFPMLRVYNSDLGKINFLSCDFGEMMMVFHASKITEIFLSGTEMPMKIEGAFAERQIGYAQLKKVYESRGDSVKSHEYLARELEAHMQSLQRANFFKRKRTWHEFFNYLTLWLNRESNNFNTSWGLAFYCLVGAGATLFMCHNFSLGYELAEYPYTLQQLHNFEEIASLFPEFLLPIHKADYISEAVDMPVTHWSRFWDFLGRVVNGFLLYQLIQAFRKYGKK
ncbi:hypothetical protein SAMN04487996_111136 [Dyadobacter soli]|uniref:Uncharacterized protein n=1 Tax=Dyadobacter soli TaxID=659014 RepID=A0A1G7M1D0_9BACT|nr:hypothetical protein [Dyadobacter soli]SDF55602.1 hypothetical protein SAMN04487996_111136 [Dyadobacter soli]